MITAHIKSPRGDRTEEWEDYQIWPSVAQYVEGADAYVFGYLDAQGEENLAVVPKQFWEIFDEVNAFAMDQPGEQPLVTAFVRDTLAELAVTFKQYLDIEKVVLQQNAFTGEECDTMLATSDQISAKNDQLYESMAPVRSLIMDREQTGELKQATRGLLQAMYDFSNELSRNVFALQVILRGLKLRSGGGDYSPLDYVRDVNLLKQHTEARHAVEKNLTDFRSAFKKVTAGNE